MNKSTLALLCLLLPLSFTMMTSAAANESNTSHMQQLLSINVNQAGVNDFAQLKGVGKKKAQAIVDYRDEFGRFESIEDLLKVKGIGNKVLSENMHLLSI